MQFGRRWTNDKVELAKIVRGEDIGCKPQFGPCELPQSVVAERLLMNWGATPGQPGCQHRQWVIQIDHGVNAAAEEVDWLHTKIPHKVSPSLTFLEGYGVHDLYKKARIHAGWRSFAGPTM